MQRYNYEALKDNKEIVKGEVEATTPKEAREKVRALGLLPLKVFEPDLVKYELEDMADNKGSIKSLSLNAKMMIVSELQVMLASGISISEALETIKVNTPTPKIKRFAEEVQGQIFEGKSFTEAINYLYYDVFGETFINLCATGESSGELEITLERLLVMLKKQDKIKSDIIQASIYPAILILILFGLIVFFSLVVFPIFTSFIINQGAEIPPFASTVMGTFKFIGDYWWLCLLGILGTIGGINILATNEHTRAFFDRLFLQIPILSDFVNYLNLSNYVCILSIAYATGVPFMKGLDLANRTIGNTEIRKKADVVNLMMEKGSTLSNAMSISNLLPGALVTMISAGEKAGNLSKMLEDCLEVIDKKIDMVLQALTKAFEPMMIITLGIVILIVAIAFMQMYLAMIQSIAMI